MGYYARKDGEGTTQTLTGEGVNPSDQFVDTKVAGISTWPYYDYLSSTFFCVPDSIEYRCKVRRSSDNKYGTVRIINGYPETTDGYSVGATYSTTSNNPLWWVTDSSVAKLSDECKTRTTELHTRAQTIAA